MKKCFTLAFLLSMIASAGAWAQNLPGNIWSSPQSTATEGRYRSNADDYIRPDSYTGLKFDKWFGMVSFKSNYGKYDNDAIATAGFAAKVSNVYIGAFYGGNFWTGAAVNNHTEQQFIASELPAGGVTGKTYKVYNNISTSSESVNNVSLLLGVADMGFRLSYRTTHHSFKKNDIVTRHLLTVTPPPSSSRQLYKNYQVATGYIAPQIAWAMARDLTKNGIRPYVTVDLVFDREYQKVETAGADAAGYSGERIAYSLNHFDPSLGIGMGGYTFYSKDGFKLSTDVDYILTLNFYNNEYSYVENSQYKTGKIKGTFSPGNFPYVEQKQIFNSFTPSLSGSWSNDRLALKFKLNLPLTLTNKETGIMGLDDFNKLINAGGANDSTATFAFRPDLRLALQYKIIPDRLTLNVGARIQATAVTLETIKRKDYDPDGNLSESLKMHNKSTGTRDDFVSGFQIGPTINFTENAWVEAMTGVSNAYGDGAIDIFAPGGLFSFGSILVVLKF
jgi:hypothetical protein